MRSIAPLCLMIAGACLDRGTMHAPIDADPLAESDPVADSDLADSDAPADTDLASDSDASPDTDPLTDTDTLSDTGVGADTDPDTDASVDTDTACARVEDTGHDDTAAGVCHVMPLQPACMSPCDLACASDWMTERSDEDLFCHVMGGTCVDASGRAYVVHVGPDATERYYDVVTGALAAVHGMEVAWGGTRCEDDRWWGVDLSACAYTSLPGPVDCDTANLCAPGEDEAVFTSTAQACDGWPGPRGVLAADPWDLSGTAIRGASPHPAGDLTGDGIDDLLVWPSSSDGVDALVYQGGPRLLAAPLAAAQAHTVVDAPAGTTWRAFATGDFDGDGQADLAVADSRAGPVPAGTVWIFRGPLPQGTISLPDAGVVIAAAAGSSEVGATLVNAGDVDHDGDDDLVVGGRLGTGWALWLPDIDAATQGAVAIDALSSWWAVGRDTRVAPIGDLDGDGNTDLAFADTPAYQPGELRLIRGPIVPAAGDSTALAADVISGGTHEGTGRTLIATDLDHDGQHELLVSSRDAVWTLRGWPAGGSTIDQVAVAAIVDPGRFNFLDAAPLAAPGDLDGDGVDDLIVGTPLDGVDRTCYASGSQRFLRGSQQGSITLIPGAALDGHLGTLATGTLMGPEPDDRMGTSLRDLGDIDADGHHDVIVSEEFSGAWRSVPLCAP